MSQYNINDFYPRTGQEIKDDGTVINEANGINTDGSRNEVTSRRATIKSVNLDNTTTVNAGVTQDIAITPPAGKMWKIRAIQLLAPAITGATSGDHRFYFTLGQADNNYEISRLINVYNANIQVRGLYPAAVSTSEPPNFQQSMPIICIATNSSPLYLRYFNNSNANQTQTRTIRLVFEEESVVES